MLFATLEKIRIAFDHVWVCRLVGEIEQLQQTDEAQPTEENKSLIKLKLSQLELAVRPKFSTVSSRSSAFSVSWELS